MTIRERSHPSIPSVSSTSPPPKKNADVILEHSQCQQYLPPSKKNADVILEHSLMLVKLGKIRDYRINLICSEPCAIFLSQSLFSHLLVIMISAQGPSDNCPPTSGGEVAGGKRGNPSQDRSRGVAGIRKSVKNLSEVCQFPVLTCYQNSTTGKLEVIGDKFTVAKVKEDQNILKKLDLYLSLSVESGESYLC